MTAKGIQILPIEGWEWEKGSRTFMKNRAGKGENITRGDFAPQKKGGPNSMLSVGGENLGGGQLAPRRRKNQKTTSPGQVGILLTRGRLSHDRQIGWEAPGGYRTSAQKVEKGSEKEPSQNSLI